MFLSPSILGGKADAYRPGLGMLLQTRGEGISFPSDVTAEGNPYPYVNHPGAEIPPISSQSSKTWEAILPRLVRPGPVYPVSQQFHGCARFLLFLSPNGGAISLPTRATLSTSLYFRPDSRHRSFVRPYRMALIYGAPSPQWIRRIFQHSRYQIRPFAVKPKRLPIRSPML